ncbi:FAD/NAD(P)-binding domain-containing protein [Trematosphaeria pertusa]|uniref:FAD/NAD(P)-binding domain-containing protein n=1 Tax=Trematosphaeria pertusa TaxID=390896 RepID=A0A6A6IZF7_9PLEO|nr:FAD/NAD(P)-binding domain-containing protein [Trematosphaeria pertusa]KAF2255824.1 FAD/NAD(P)-binding domain-containing protein [Trematosphaeria pertusa]
MIGETIRRVNGYDHDAYTYYPVLIVGAGASGIAMACRLKDELGFDQFRIFERQAGIGGTWWINRYPGVACDVPAVFYSFSFAQNPDWTSFYPPGREIVQYYHDVCQKYNITDKFELNTDVEQCRWLEDEQIWEVTLRRMIAGMGDISAKDRMKIVKEKGESAVYSETEVVRAKVVISCVGGLVEPKGWPDEIPGIESFKGPVFHSARWDESVDFTDKNVVVVGTGCSSAQLVPRLPHAPYNAKSVLQLMRSPPWVVPSFIPPGGDEWWEKNSAKLLKTVPGLLQTLRFTIFAGAEIVFKKLFPNTPQAEKNRQEAEEKLMARMKKIVPEKYHEMLTPNYGIGCKRRIFDKRWYQSLNEPNIELTTQPLTRVNEHSVIIGPGAMYPPAAKGGFPEREVPADVIVLANGFDTTKWLHPLKVAGKGGKDLVDTMEERGGAQAYQGTAMDGFPNFFIIFGPNTATGHSSVVLATENMVNYSLKFIKLLLNGEASTVDVKHDAEVAYTNEIQRSLKDTVFMSGGCTSWYFTSDGWNSTVYPYSQVDFWRRCTFAKWGDWNISYTKKGISHIRRIRVVRFLAVTLAIIGAYRMRQKGLGIKDAKVMLQQVLQRSLTSTTGLLISLRQQAASRLSM